MSYLYFTILQYRKGDSTPKVAYLHDHSWPSSFMILLGLSLIIFNLMIGHPAIADPYSWSTLENQLYMSVFRVSYVFALCLILTSMLTGKFNRGLYLLSSSNMRALGKITFVNAIISPIVIALLYNTGQDAMYVSFNVVLFLGLGNAFCCTVFSLIFLILIEFPVKNLLSTVKKWASHDSILM